MMYTWDTRCSIDRMVGQTMASVERGTDGASDTLTFTTVNGVQFVFHYEPDCCARCDIESIVGDLADLVGVPLLMAEEATSRDDPPDAPAREYPAESQTWTFYKFATIKGYVDVRWYGESNGYYSESVSLHCLERVCHNHEDCETDLALAIACAKGGARG